MAQAPRERYRLWRWGLVALGLYAIATIPAWYGEFLWFGQVGYEPVFLTILGYRLALFAIATGGALVVGYASYRVAARNLESIDAGERSVALRLGIGVLAVLVGLTFSGGWDTVVRFAFATPFGTADPVFGRDVSFFVYSLPFYNLVVRYFMALIAAGFLVTIAVNARAFAAIQDVSPPDEDAVAYDLAVFMSFLRRHGYAQLVGYVGAFLVVLGVSFYLDRFELVFSPRGAVFGVGATDRTIFLPLLGLLAVTGVIGGLVVLVNTRFQDPRAVYIPIAIIIGFVFVGNAAGFVYQDFVVEPDEFNKEEPFLRHEIEFTNDAYALDRIQEQEFPVSDTLTPGQVRDNPGTIENVRLWDPRPLLTTYNELQIFRTYYMFRDVDIDRYEVDGRETQVMVSARELEFEALPEASQTWVNRHLVYTHGFGVAMSPVSQVTSDGLPDFYIKDIPPNSTVDIPVTQPRIYYGEATTDYAIVNSGTRELDYPSSGQNVYTRYDADGGVPLDSALREAVYSIKFGSPQILLSDSVTAESRIQFNRAIDTRARAIAPFLDYDRDPYIVVSDGELYWLYDAYTTTNNYPYANRMTFKGDRINYVRNAVKVVVDAHTGETTYYVAEPDDPLIQTYQKAFPGLFKPFDEMPRDLRRHVRYPEDAFRAQAQQYLLYHMREPQTFYNKEDAWRIPNEITRGEEIPMDPYYIIMTFPGEDNPEFVMIQPYIPEGRQNMIGWLAARSDPPNYGSLKAFLFSKQRLVFGPMQIESRIDQDAQISQQITLWSQAGSSVIRGNLLAIPIDDTIIYVEPLFLESQEQGALPELKRVILSHGDRVTMQPTLEEAIAVQIGARIDQPQDVGAGLSQAQLERAQTLYEEAQAALRNGDFATYAERITELGALLDETDAESEDASAN